MPDAAPDPPGRGRHARLARPPQPRPLCEHRFAHPVEREFARVLDELRVPWLYEPHTFVLERRPDGEIARAFTPDFYLPEQDFYLEVTVARRCLTGAKRKKVEESADAPRHRRRDRVPGGLRAARESVASAPPGPSRRPGVADGPERSVRAAAGPPHPPVAQQAACGRPLQRSASSAGSTVTGVAPQ
jgi:hypothetical protein